MHEERLKRMKLSSWNWKRHHMRILSTKRPSLKTKKALLQKGGFIGAFVLSFLGGVVSNAIILIYCNIDDKVRNTPENCLSPAAAAATTSTTHRVQRYTEIT